MRYTFQCDQEEHSGCGEIFVVECMMSEITDLKPKCPECGKWSNVIRVWEAPTAFVPKTLGSLAERNSRLMSSDQKQELTQKYTEYRKQEFSGKLPEGTKLYERDKDGNRIPRS